MSKVEILTHEEWLQEARSLFGDDPLEWEFQCVICGHVQKGRDFLDLELTPGKGQEELSREEIAMNRVFMSCIGRWKDGVGCDWTLGGFLQLHTRAVIFGEETIPVFPFHVRPNPWEDGS